MRRLLYTTQAEIRAAFWEAHPDADRRKIKNYAGDGTMHTTDTRTAFVAFVDMLSRDGSITEGMADRVTLEPGKRQPGKFRDEFACQGRYNGRWEDLCAEDTRAEALKRRREYEANAPETVYRVVRRRVLKKAQA